ncbi:MAG: thiamine pyrophosphate-dependent enzyme, partial [Ilumatobacteraceae bacterium]
LAPVPIQVGPPGLPRFADLRAAAAVLDAGERVVMLVGAGALGAADEVIAVADALGAPIVKALSGKAAVPDDHPLTTGGLGLLGTKPSESAMDECDTVFMVGSSFPYTAFLPEPDAVRCVQIDIDPVRAGNRLPTEVPLVGDAKETLAALLPLLARKEDRSFLEGIQEEMVGWRERMEALEDGERDPIQPQYVVSVLDRLAADDAILTCDSGTIATWAARHFHIRGSRQFYLSGNLASMAPGLPYAIAAQVAYPQRQCIAFVGDGGFAMLMAEFLTACRYELPITVVVDNNALYGQILWEQMVLGYPEHCVRWERRADFAPWATACGGLGLRVDLAADVEPAIRQALEHRGPSLVDVAVNPDEPPMPASVTYDQAKGFTKAFLHGQGRRASIVSTIFRDKLQQLKS